MSLLLSTPAAPETNARLFEELREIRQRLDGVLTALATSSSHANVRAASTPRPTPITYATAEESYAAMAADEEREAEAKEWINGVIGDIPYEPW